MEGSPRRAYGRGARQLLRARRPLAARRASACADTAGDGCDTPPLRALPEADSRTSGRARAAAVRPRVTAGVIASRRDSARRWRPRALLRPPFGRQRHLLRGTGAAPRGRQTLLRATGPRARRRAAGPEQRRRDGRQLRRGRALGAARRPVPPRRVVYGWPRRLRDGEAVAGTGAGDFAA